MSFDGWKNYTKRPVTVQAVRLTRNNVRDIGSQIGAHRIHNVVGRRREVIALGIETLEGLMTAKIGDYIIKGVQGEYYPCKADIFRATYEAAESNDG